MSGVYDFVIVGAGVIGAATAYHLKLLASDARILVVEQEKRVGAGNTAKSTALYRNIFSSSTSKALAGSSIGFYKSIADRIHSKSNGYLWLFSDDQWESLHAARKSLNLQADHIDELSRDDIRGILSIQTEGNGTFPSVDHGLLGRECGSLSPSSLARFYADGFVANGGEIKLSTKIDSLNLRGRETLHAPWSGEKGIKKLDSDAGEGIAANTYIFAVGAWSQQMLGKIGVFTGVLPKKRQLFGIEIDTPLKYTPNQPEKVPVVILPAGGVHIKPILERNMLVIGMAGDLGIPFEVTDTEATEAYFNTAIRPALRHYFPEIGNSPVKTKWAGYYAYHWPDKNPVIESEENFMWVSGTSGSGIMKADALGRIAAAKALGLKTATLYDGTTFGVDDLSLSNRHVENELFVI